METDKSFSVNAVWLGMIALVKVLHVLSLIMVWGGIFIEMYTELNVISNVIVNQYLEANTN